MRVKKLETLRNKIVIGRAFIESLTLQDHSVYVAVGRTREWEPNVVPQPKETQSNLLTIFDTLVGMKKVTGSDCSLIARRIDWQTGKVYDEYSQELDIFSYERREELSGTSSADAGQNLIVGANTAYETELSVGDFILMLGDENGSPLVTKEIVDINVSQQTLTVNSSFSSSYTDNTAFKVVNTFPAFANEFYVRNSKDQVFKCLFNNFGAESTVQPEISLDGNLPQNLFIQTSDGYKWKYMYTIPSGLKEKFFTKDWMPVVKDNVVSDSAVNGRIDVVTILNGGSGYSAGLSQSSADILDVVGDGVGAKITAQVTNGVITGINIFNVGSGYTRATVSVNDPNKLPATTEASIKIEIGPQNGHGFDPFYELGAGTVMISVDLESDENGTIPTESGAEKFDFRKIALLKNPLNHNNEVLQNSNYRTSSIINISSPPANYTIDEIVYQGDSLAGSTFSGVVVDWKSQNNEIWINNITGNFQSFTPLRGTLQDTAVTAFGLSRPEYQLYSGEILYIENREPVVRNVDQTEQIKLVFSF